MNRGIPTGLTALMLGCSPVPSAQVAKQEIEYRGISIDGPPYYVERMKSALEMVYYTDPESWSTVHSNITLFRLNPPSGINVHSGVCNTDNNIRNAHGEQSLQWVAGEIVHDAWHREYYRRGEAYSGWEGEKKCMERQNEFFWKIGYPRLNIERMLKIRYWEVQPRTW